MGEALREQIHDRLHIAQRRVRCRAPADDNTAAALQLAVAGGHGIEQTLRQPQSAETLAADGRNPQPLPLRFQHFIQIIFQIERNERQTARVFGNPGRREKSRFMVSWVALVGRVSPLRAVFFIG